MPDSNQPNSLQFSDLNKHATSDRQQAPSSQAAAAANQLFDQANDSVLSPQPVLDSGELQAGVPVNLKVEPTQASVPPPKLSQSHEFGPIAPPLSTDLPSASPEAAAQAQEPAPAPQPTPPQSPAAPAQPSDETRLKRLARQLRVNKIFSKRSLTYLGIGLASFAVFYLIFNFQNIMLQVNYALHKPPPEPAISVPDATQLTKAPEAQAAPPGNVIIIPKINVNAPIVFEPSNDEQAIQVALRSGVVHYAQTGLPGRSGNAVIVGHSSLDPWSPGKYKFVFALLEKVSLGDQIQINYEQKKYVYQVTETKVVAPTDLSVLAQSTEPTLTLITCTPAGTNWRRFIVHAKQVEPLPAAKIALKDSTQAQAPVATDLPGKSPFFLDKIRDFFKHLFGQ